MAIAVPKPVRLGQVGRRRGALQGLALDAIALMDVLKIRRVFVAGHDWGSNAGKALAVGWPRRVQRLAMLSTPSRLGGLPTRRWSRRSVIGATGSRRPSARHGADAVAEALIRH